MKFTLFTSDTAGNAKNCFYKQKIMVTDATTLASAVPNDYVAAKYTDDYRKLENFERSDCIVMDCDNNHSDKPEDWVRPKDVAQTFPNVAFAVHYSRNHLKPKDGKAARPKFHVLFPINEIANAKEYSVMKRKVADILPYFDNKALDAARFFFGTEDPKIEFCDGSRNLTAFLEEYDARQVQSLVTTSIDTINVTSTEKTKNNLDEHPEHQNGIISQGTRNSTMLNFAETLLKQYGASDTAYRDFLNESQKCRPLLNDNELQAIWKNAKKFYYDEIITKKDYVKPEIFNDKPFVYEPHDYTDTGEAQIFCREYKEKVKYSTEKKFFVYTDKLWEEDELIAQSRVQEFTSKQLDEAEYVVAKAEENLRENGIVK